MAIDFADIYARGGGSLEYRLVIEGAPYEVCTGGMLVGACTESGHVGKRRITGLERDSIGFTESVDAAEARLRVNLSRVRILDGRTDGSTTQSGGASDMFSRLEVSSLLTWLTADLESGASSMTVADPSAITSGDFLHVGSEVLLCGTPSGSVVPITRAQWGTTAQRSAVTSGGGATTYQPVYTHVPGWRKRRVWLYAHTKDELALGDLGTLVYRGVVSSQPSEDAGEWTFTVESRWSVLSGEIGPAESGDYRVRGIYYPGTAPFNVQIGQHATATRGTTSAVAYFAMVGFWETQGEFCAALTAALNAHATIGTWATWSCVERDDGGWEMIYTTPSSGERYIQVIGWTEVDGAQLGAVSSRGPASGYLRGDIPDGEHTTVLPSTSYVCLWRRSTEGDRMVPRRNIPTERSAFYERLIPTADVASYPAGRVHLTSTRGLVVGSALVLPERTSASGDWPSQTLEVTTVNTSAGYVDAYASASVANPPLLAVAGPGQPDISFSVRFGSSSGTSVAGFIDALIAAAPELANDGAAPWLLADDFATDWGDVVAAATHDAAWANRRDYVFTEATRLDDIIREELKLIGCFPYLDADFRIAIRPLTWETREVAASRVMESGTSSHFTGDDLGPKLDFDGEGTINSVTYSTGWDPVEKKHLGGKIEIIGAGPLAREKQRLDLPIEPKSVALGGDIDPGSALALGRATVALFGTRAPHVIVTAPLSWWPVLCGDTVLLTLDELPFNGVRGLHSPGEGLVNVTGRVVERSWKIGEDPIGTFRVQLKNLDVAGYSPAGRVASASGAGTAWTLTLEANYYGPPGTTDAGFFRVGDVIELRQWDADTPATVPGTVTAISGNDVSVSLPASWAGLGGNTYVLHYDATDSPWQESQRKYAAIAGAELYIPYDSERESARVFG